MESIARNPTHRSFIQIALLIAAFSAVPAFAAVKCGQVGPGAVAVNNVGAGPFGVANGPYTCADADAYLGFGTPRDYQQREGSVGPVSVGTSASSYTIFSSSVLGSNHLQVMSGSFASADSEWADVGMIVGPHGVAETVPVLFSGHIDGSLTLNGQRSDAAAASITFWFGVGSTGYTYQADAFSEVADDIPTHNRTAGNVAHSFTLLVNLPTNSAFGMVGALSGQIANGGAVDFSNSASIDRIVVPSGYSASAHGVALKFDGSGYTYAPVPEPSGFVMLLFGLPLIANRSLRRRRLASLNCS